MAAQLTPLDVPILSAGWFRPSRAQYWVWGFVALGVVIRLVGYLLCFPLWVDECMLGENLLDRGYIGLLEPLGNHQVAPPGFLWVELASVRLLGFSEYSLRLFPLLCGIASLFVFRYLASRLLTGVPLILAVACLAVAKAPQGLSANFKPYASDLLVATLLLALAVEWLRDPGRTGRLWALAAATPVAVFFSYPAFFVVAAISAGLGVQRGRIGSSGRAYLALNAALAVSLAGLLWQNAGPAAEATREFMFDYWVVRGGFPPSGLTHNLHWLIDVHLGDKIFAVPYAAANGGGVLVLACFLIGVVALYRRGQRRLTVILLTTFALALGAGLAGRYPYGGHNRIMQFLVPAIALAGGLGAAEILGRVAQPARRRLARALVLTLAIFGAALAVRDCLYPYHLAVDAEHRDFASRFWAAEPDALTVCAITDLGQEFSPSRWYAYYRCNQQIYSPGHHEGQKLGARELERLGRPFRLVIYHPPDRRHDREPVADCFQRLESKFAPAGTHWLILGHEIAEFDRYGDYETFHLVPHCEPESPYSPATIASW